MRESLDAAAVRQMFVAVSIRMIENTGRLTTADQAIGDGDHGIGMRRGFTAALDQLEKAAPSTAGEVFKVVGTAVMSQSGGASGAIFGTLYRAGEAAVGDVLDAETFADFLAQGLVAVQRRGGATQGGKTMLDALTPAVEAARNAVGDGLAAAVKAAAVAAETGTEATKAMIATTGKARTLGHRSLGYPDPGAISLSIQLGSMSEFSAAYVTTGLKGIQ